MSTVADLVTAARVRLDEASAHEWSDADQITPYISRSERWLADELGKLQGSGLFRYRESVTLAASTETIAFSAFGAVATKTFVELLGVAKRLDGSRWVNLKQFADEDESTLRNAGLSSSGLIIPRYRLWDTAVQLLPTDPASSTIALAYRWIPVVKTSGTIETPVMEDDLLVLRACILALGDRKERNKALDEEFGVRFRETIERYEGRQYGARGERVKSRVARLLYR